MKVISKLKYKRIFIFITFILLVVMVMSIHFYTNLQLFFEDLTYKKVYVCQKYVDCIPPIGSSTPQNRFYCSDDYDSWAHKNCDDYQGRAY